MANAEPRSRSSRSSHATAVGRRRWRGRTAMLVGAIGGGGARDTYWTGKELGRLATLHGLATQLGMEQESERLAIRLRARLEAWFDARVDPAEPATGGAFLYDRRWGALIGYPSSY